MKTNDPQRHQIIKSLLSPLSGRIADAAVHVWEQMAIQIIFIVGEDGFNSLYARSIFLNQPTFPWLVASPLASQTDHRFAGLKTSLEGQTPAQASEANGRLLITFTDILASLIGEQFTAHILRLAWGVDLSNKPY